MFRTAVPTLAAIGALALGACGGTTSAVADGPDGDVAPPAAGACLEGVPDCVDTVVDPGGEQPPPDLGDDFDSDAALTTGEALLGDAEEELAGDVRVSRRGEEMFALTEDYVLGRLTVELDDDGTGTYRVTSVVVELPEGPETLTTD